MPCSFFPGPGDQGPTVGTLVGLQVGQLPGLVVFTALVFSWPSGSGHSSCLEAQSHQLLSGGGDGPCSSRVTCSSLCRAGFCVGPSAAAWAPVPVLVASGRCCPLVEVLPTHGPSCHNHKMRPAALMPGSWSPSQHSDPSGVTPHHSGTHSADGTWVLEPCVPSPTFEMAAGLVGSELSQGTGSALLASEARPVPRCPEKPHSG